MTLLSAKTVTTRKPCVCFGCAREIPAGSRVNKIARSEFGEFIASNWCQVCDAYWTKYMDHHDEIMMGDLRDGNEWEEMRRAIED